LSEQSENLDRVRSRIADVVLAWCREHVGGEFRMDELRKFVQLAEPTAPDSASRILRDLRQRGRVRYVVLSRADSLYRIDAVNDDTEKAA
jgi:hypothetical protein